MGETRPPGMQRAFNRKDRGRSKKRLNPLSLGGKRGHWPRSGLVADHYVPRPEPSTLSGNAELHDERENL